MQPTVESQTRLKRLTWLLSLLLALTIAFGGLHVVRQADEIRAGAAALDSARRDLADARRAADAAETAVREAGAQAQAAATARDAFEAKLQAAEAARAAAEARLKAAAEKPPVSAQE